MKDSFYLIGVTSILLMIVSYIFSYKNYKTACGAFGLISFLVAIVACFVTVTVGLITPAIFAGLAAVSFFIGLLFFKIKKYSDGVLLTLFLILMVIHVVLLL